jgi:hypothetical protein
MVSGRVETGIVRRDEIGAGIVKLGHIIGKEDVGDARAWVGIEDDTDQGATV